MLPPKLITVIPVFDEAATIAGVVERALAYGPVLVVDDGSTDDTSACAAQSGAEVIRHPRRLGKGQAIRTGMRAAAIRGASAVVTLDGDGQHDPADIDRLLAAAAAAPSALIVGSRLERASGLLRGRLNAIRVAGFFMNWVTGVRVEDTQSGFRLYPLDVVRELPTRRGGFVFETEVLVAAARRGVAVREVPVRTVSRAARRSRFRPIVDGVLIGAYLAERSGARCLVEARDAVAAVGAVFSRQRRAARHGALLLEASVYRHAPALWAMSLGTGAAHQASARLLRWWRHPRRRRAAAAAASVTVSPLLLGAVVCQSVVDVAVSRLRGRAAPDLVTPIVARWFSQARLVTLDADESRIPATDAAHDVPAPLALPPAVLSPSRREGATALR